MLGDKLASYLFILCIDNILWMLTDLIKENDLTLKMARSRRYLAETIKDYLIFFTNTSDQAEFLLHSLEQTAGGIGPNVNANKTEYMCLK